MQQSISDIKYKLEQLSLDTINDALDDYRLDERIGVKKLIESYEKKLEAIKKEINRLHLMRVFERKYDHLEFIAGIDEVGRGPLAGPVVTAAVILPKDASIFYVNDSKQLSEQKREELYLEIMEKAIAVSVGIIHADVIDEINILNATKKAMQQAIFNLTQKPDVVLVDALTIPDIFIRQEGIIKGDEKSVSIAAASIIAKVTRDRMMQGYDLLYPEYYFGKNKGYGTNEHILALKQYGPSPIHRESFIKNFPMDSSIGNMITHIG